MNPKLTSEAVIYGFGEIYCPHAGFVENLEIISRNGLDLMSLGDFAYARMQLHLHGDLHNPVVEDGSWVREGALVDPGEQNPTILLRDSLVLKNPAAAVQAHANEREYFLGDDFNAKEFLETLPKDNFFVIKDYQAVPTKRFGEDGLMVWCFGKHAQDYGLFLNSLTYQKPNIYGPPQVGIERIGFHLYTRYDDYVYFQHQAFAHQLNLAGLGLDCSSRHIRGREKILSLFPRILGIRRESPGRDENQG